MAVLIEGLSVVVRIPAIEEKMTGGYAVFMQSLPNRTFRSDGALACVHFMTPNDVRDYVEALEQAGLIYRGADDLAVDLVVVDQHQGPMIMCNWLVFGRADWDNDPAKPVAVCSALPAPAQLHQIVAPAGWQYATSLTASARFIDGSAIPPQLKFLRHENGTDVLLDQHSGREFFIARR